jgi:excisionase family DNA binding protein
MQNKKIEKCLTLLGFPASIEAMSQRVFMSTKKAAKLLGVSRQTLYNWLNDAKIPEPQRHPRTGHLQWQPQDIQRIRLLKGTGSYMQREVNAQ